MKPLNAQVTDEIQTNSVWMLADYLRGYASVYAALFGVLCWLGRAHTSENPRRRALRLVWLTINILCNLLLSLLNIAVTFYHPLVI